MKNKQMRKAAAAAPTAARAIRSLREEIRHGYEDAREVWGMQVYGAKALAGSDFEHRERDFMASALEHADVLVDIGANVGLYSLLASRMGKGVVAIEPLAENQRYLYRNLWSNGAKDVTVWPVAVGPTRGIIELFGGGTGASAIEGWAQAPEEMRRYVPAHRLDDLLASTRDATPCIVKIDVEGFELEVLKGGVGLAETDGVSWIIEICLDELHPDGRNPSFLDTFSFFFERGYSCSFAIPGGQEVTPDDITNWDKAGKWTVPTNNFHFAVRHR